MTETGLKLRSETVRFISQGDDEDAMIGAVEQRKVRMRAFCKRCRHDQVFVRAHISHPLHIFLSVLSVGLWLISYISLLVGTYFWPWRCKHCNWHEPTVNGIPQHAQKRKEDQKDRVGLRIVPLDDPQATADAQTKTNSREKSKSQANREAA